MSDTKLADRAGASETAEGGSATPTPRSPALDSATGGVAKGKGREADIASPNDALVKLRKELASTQKVRADLAGRLKNVSSELEASHARATAGSQKIEELTREKTGLERKIHDREHEIREKNSLLRVCRGYFTGHSRFHRYSCYGDDADRPRMDKTRLSPSHCSSTWLKSEQKNSRRRIKSSWTVGWRAWVRKLMP